MNAAGNLRYALTGESTSTWPSLWKRDVDRGDRETEQTVFLRVLLHITKSCPSQMGKRAPLTLRCRARRSRTREGCGSNKTCPAVFAAQDGACWVAEIRQRRKKSGILGIIIRTRTGNPRGMQRVRCEVWTEPDEGDPAQQADVQTTFCADQPSIYQSIRAQYTHKQGLFSRLLSPIRRHQINPRPVSRWRSALGRKSVGRDRSLVSTTG